MDVRGLVLLLPIIISSMMTHTRKTSYVGERLTLKDGNLPHNKVKKFQVPWSFQQEGQELTHDCVGTTWTRRLPHRHTCCIHPHGPHCTSSRWILFEVEKLHPGIPVSYPVLVEYEMRLLMSHHDYPRSTRPCPHDNILVCPGVSTSFSEPPLPPPSQHQSVLPPLNPASPHTRE